jgi:hypothetical protein
MLQVYANYILTNFKILPVGLGGEAELGAAAAGDGGGESRCPRLSGRGRWWGRGCRAVGGRVAGAARASGAPSRSRGAMGRAPPELQGAGARWARGEGGAAGAQRRRRVRTGGVVAREDGGRATTAARRRRSGGRRRKERLPSEREKLRAEAD